MHRHRGESAEAEQCWRRILTLTRPDQFCSVDMGIYGHLTRRNLAALAAERGDPAEAARLWRACWPNAPATARHWPCSGEPQVATPARREPGPE